MLKAISLKSKYLPDYQLSRELAAKGQWEKALQKIKICLSSEPDNRKYQKLLQEITRHKEVNSKIEQARQAEEGGNFGQTLEIYRIALETKTSYNKQLKTLIKETKKRQQEFGELYKQAQHLYEREKYSKANLFAHRLLKMTPKHWDILTLIQNIETKEHSQMFYSEAMAHYKRSQFQLALKKVAHSLELDHDFAAARILLAKIGTSQTCQKYQLSGEWKHKKKLQETIQLLEGLVEPADD